MLEIYRSTENCTICGIHKNIVELVLDHDHKTMVFRNMLCQHCNLMLGHAKDNPLILIRAAEYLNNGGKIEQLLISNLWQPQVL